MHIAKLQTVILFYLFSQKVLRVEKQLKAFTKSSSIKNYFNLLYHKHHIKLLFFNLAQKAT